MAKLEKRLSKRIAKVDRRVARLNKKVTKQAKESARAQRAKKRAKSKEPEWTYKGDGMATTHLTPFLDDPTFLKLYEEMAADWFPNQGRVEARWRAWLVTRFAQECQGLEGSFAEFGTYRAGYAFMVLALTEVEQFYLFDTFSGIPSDRLTENEQRAKFAGRLADTSPEYVAQRLSRWAGRFEICAGDVFDVLPQRDTGPLTFVSMDLNATAPTVYALEYAYPRLVPGGTIVFDDYGAAGFHDQRAAIDEFFAEQPDHVIALPTCQGILTKRVLS